MLVLEPDTVLALKQGIVLHSLPEQDHFFAFSVITGDEFELNHTSYWVLEAVGESIEWGQLKSVFLDTFAVSVQRGEIDLRKLVEQLYDENIIRRQDDEKQES